MVKILVSVAFIVIALAYGLYWRATGGNLFLGL
jgi:hypothetical protein